MNLSLIDYYLCITCAYGLAMLILCGMATTLPQKKFRKNSAVLSSLLHVFILTVTVVYYYVGPEFSHQGLPTDAHNSVPAHLH